MWSRRGSIGAVWRCARNWIATSTTTAWRINPVPTRLLSPPRRERLSIPNGAARLVCPQCDLSHCAASHKSLTLQFRGQKNAGRHLRQAHPNPQEALPTSRTGLLAGAAPWLSTGISTSERLDLRPVLSVCPLLRARRRGDPSHPSSRCGGLVAHRFPHESQGPP